MTLCFILSYFCTFYGSYSVHSIEMNDGVTRVFERAIVVLSRKEDPSDLKYALPLFDCYDCVGLIYYSFS